MMWDKTTTKTSALASSDRTGPLKALSPALPPARPEETMVFALYHRTSTVAARVGHFILSRHQSRD